MNSLLNTIRLNSVSLNLVGMTTRKRGGGGSDIPEGYAEFITADDMIFSAYDDNFYVKL